MRAAFDLELDLRGLPAVDCISRTVTALAELHVGQIVRALTSDPDSLAAFKALPAQTGHTLVRASRTEDGDFLFYVEKI